MLQGRVKITANAVHNEKKKACTYIYIYMYIRTSICAYLPFSMNHFEL